MVSNCLFCFKASLKYHVDDDGAVIIGHFTALLSETNAIFGEVGGSTRIAAEKVVLQQIGIRNVGPAV